ncbi:hypothetical protein BC938DRAFT_472554 [Jimgerdemannia flammicorona]|uniref:RecQ-mediated genome instability protein 1 n=1 Tax=Jimgerdemannia flammicorona TaxID=994334 RepID=A0A433Q5U5_9FUNG|nr:hypothetical protein BC938DRAFT_472554 [Jimgerdemannia flammicorona]
MDSRQATHIRTTKTTTPSHNYIMLLPPNTQALHKVTLPGTYLLNVTDLVDIGVSLHSLLQVATATPPPVRHVYREGTPATDQLKFPRAMLKLTLTDGVQDVQAMEYKPLPALSMNSLLGLKVRSRHVFDAILVKAPRVLRGVMLLEPDNVEIFGGAVPELYGSDLAAEVTRRLKPRLKCVMCIFGGGFQGIYHRRHTLNIHD